MLHLAPKNELPDTTLFPILNAVDGYLCLNMPHVALGALNEISLENQFQSEVLISRIRVLLHLRRWKVAEFLSEKGALLHPDENEFIVQRAFALHQMNRTEKALDVILSAPDWIHRTGILHYNLACYEARLGDVTTARNCVDTAIKLNHAFKKNVRTDPDLERLRS